MWRQVMMIVAATCVAFSPRAAGQPFSGGDFETPDEAWRVSARGDACRPSAIVYGVNLPDPPGPSSTYRHAARIFGGCDVSMLFQRFSLERDDTAAAYVTVSFDADAWRCGVADIAIVLRTRNETRAWQVPAVRWQRSDPREDRAQPTRAGRYRVSARYEGGPVLLEFVAWGDVGSTALIDNISAVVSPVDQTDGSVASIAPSTVPVLQLEAGPGATVGEPLSAGMDERDCNTNQIPDPVEICRHPALDEDGDGALDRCNRGRFNWQLLLLGLLVLIAVIVRLATRHRARNRL